MKSFIYNLIVIVLLVIIIAAVGIIVIFKKNNVERIEEVAQETNNNLEIETSYLDYTNEEWTKLTYEVAKKNGDWSKLPLTDEFRNKYNEKDGIFGNMQFDKVEYKPYKDNNKYYFNWYSYLVITQGLKKTVYLYSEERWEWMVGGFKYLSFV